jgi:hypothetical protein
VIGMDLNLGAVAFWLAIGAFLTAGALSGWLREKEIQKTIRAMIERDGKIDAETLAMIRKHDIEAQAMEHAYWGGGITGLQALAAGVFALSVLLAIVGLAYFLRDGDGTRTPNFFVAAGVFVGSVTVGSVAAWLIGRKANPSATKF